MMTDSQKASQETQFTRAPGPELEVGPGYDGEIIRGDEHEEFGSSSYDGYVPEDDLPSNGMWSSPSGTPFDISERPPKRPAVGGRRYGTDRPEE